MKVYLVTESDYESYWVNAVYTDKSLAEKYVERYGGDVEERDCDTITEFIPKGIDLWRVYMTRNGKDVDARIENNAAEWK